MTSQAQIRNSPYLVAFALAAMMVLSFSTITRSMEGALQQTHVQLRAPIADLGTAIQDSAIALRHRLKPPAPAEQPSRHEPLSNDGPMRTPPLMQDALTPVVVQEVTALTDLIASSTPGKDKGRGLSGQVKQSRSARASARANGALGPPKPVTDSPPGKAKGKGKAPAHAGR
ncbi:MAG TPA: hypothetical protein VNA87_02230 [Actinomycetota bacterium]|nr:hypothetical protein [Actinomycetota bacterium]